MKNLTKWTIAVGGTLVFGAAAFFAGRAFAVGIPATKALTYTGLLQNADGTPFSGTGHNLEIRLWNDPASTAIANLLCDTSSQPLVTDSTGHFSQPLSDDCTKGVAENKDTYVEVLLDGAVLGGKRAKLGAVPYAVESNHAVSGVISIVKQVTAALTAAHAKGVVHRDLKPGNIYLLRAAGETDFVKVVDFGISKVLSATTKITRTWSVVGTPNYMSPEQAKGQIDDIDERTDQWALACIAWECLSGRSPFRGENVPSILFQIVHEPLPSLLPIVPGLHPGVEEVLLRALAKKKDERFPGLSQFSEALEAAATACPAGARAPEPAPRSGVVEVTPTVCLPAPPVDQSQASTPAGTEILVPRPNNTTFSQSAVAVTGSRTLPKVKRQRSMLVGVGSAATAALLLGGILLFRSGPAPRPASPAPLPAFQPPLTLQPAPTDRPEPANQLPAVSPEPQSPKSEVAPSHSASKDKALASGRRPAHGRNEAKRRVGSTSVAMPTATEPPPTVSRPATTVPVPSSLPAQQPIPSTDPKRGIKW